MKGKHIIADLDGTLCESRQIISKQMKKKLLSLEPIVVISGAEKERIQLQMDGTPCIIMAQNGNDAPDWQNKLTKKEVKEILNHIASLPMDFTEDCIQNRGCQVSLSFTGHNADISWKKKFDPNKKFRQFVLKQFPFKSKTLVVSIAGTTCLDYNRRGNSKGDNLKRYMKLHGLKKKDCVYYGDNLDKGGNDESVIGIMPTVAVKNPADLLSKLKS